LYGDPVNRTPGLIDKVDTLLAGMSNLSADVEQLKRRRTKPSCWVFGYVVYCIAGVFAIFAVVNMVPGGNDVGNLAPEVSAVIAVILAVVALILLLSGHGWIRGE